MWWVDDGLKVSDSEHSQVGDSKSSNHGLGWSELVDLCLFGQFLDGLGDLGQSLGISVWNEGSEQSVLSIDGDIDINSVKLSDEGVIPSGINSWNLLEGESAGLDDEIVDGELVFSILCLLIKLLAQLEERVDFALLGKIVMWDLLLGLSQASSSDLANGRVRNIGIRSTSNWSRLRWSRCLSWLSLGRSSLLGGFVGDGLEDVSFDDAISWSGSLEGVDVDIVLSGLSSRSRACHQAARGF